MKRIKLILINILVFLILGELALRLFGFTSLYPYKVYSSPQNCLLPSTETGFLLNPGVYRVTINENLKYTATHEDHGWCRGRTTGMITADSLILFTGCSFTYGMGVDDSLTYPNRLQSLLPKYKIINAATPAHGTLQTLGMLDKLEAAQIKPRLLIYPYIDTHEERNILTRSFTCLLGRESRVNNEQKVDLAKKSLFPCGKLDEEGQLSIYHSHLKTKNLFTSLRRYSALANQFEYVYSRLFSKKKKARKVTEAAILEIKRRCEANNIPFLIAILKENKACPMQAFCTQHQISFADLTIDYSDEKLLNLPYDGHPNGLAHGIYAEKLMEKLGQIMD